MKFCNSKLYEATWSPQSQISGIYSTQVKIRVTANDNEGNNNATRASSANFTLDTAGSTGGSPALSINPNSTTPGTANLSISATDNSLFQMKIGLNSDLSDASWENYSASKTITLQTDPDTVYYQFKDAYNNTSSIFSSTTPTTPQQLLVQDISNLKTTPPEYKLFISWNVIQTPTPGFKQYNIYRSTDNSNFSLVTVITDIDNNYYVDLQVTQNQFYYYKITSEDQDDNVSFFTTVVQAQPDGIQNFGEIGISDTVPPAITNIQTSGITSSKAIVTFTTNEDCLGSIDYGTTTSYDKGAKETSNITSHSITLQALNYETPNTVYF